jgi:multisubunit Na+/H+ antiporter MnhB subunit
MNDTNPYATTQNTSHPTGARGRRFTSALMALGFVLVGIALYMFIFAESFTFYTPYSLESSDWILHLPNGLDYSINSYVGVSAMIGSAVLGILLLTISSALKIRLLLKRGAPQTH